MGNTPFSGDNFEFIYALLVLHIQKSFRVQAQSPWFHPYLNHSSHNITFLRSIINFPGKKTVKIGKNWWRGSADYATFFGVCTCVQCLYEICMTLPTFFV